MKIGLILEGGAMRGMYTCGVIDTFLDENIKVFELIKNKISPKLYKDLLNLYIDYKQKYL